MPPPAPPAAVPSPASTPQGRYSADGAWWWNGAQWVPAQGPAVPASTAAAPGLRAAKARSGPWRRVLALALVFATVLGLLGVYGLFIADGPTESQLSGHAFLAMPLTEATVAIYEMRSDGQPGPLLATTVTDKYGYYTASVQRRPSSSLLVLTSGGRYVDEVTRKSLPADDGNSLKTIVRPGGSYSSITPLTTFAAAGASSLATSGKPLNVSVAATYAAVARQFGLDTITDVDPAIADDPQSVQVSGRTARQYGLILAGLAEEANALDVSSFALTDALARDMSDGRFDGQNGASPVVIRGTVRLPADASATRLQEAINRAAAAPGNVTRVSTPQISLSTLDIDLNTAGLVYVSSTVLPAWIDGQAAAVTIQASGGTTPYTCATAGGQLPQGFSLSRDCTISGGGTPVLGTSPMRITPPFTVTLSDASQPPQSVSVDLRITIIAKPPEITVSAGRCPKAGLACSVTVATATGGTPPYYFTNGGFGSGTPPLGMIVNLKGVLTGTPAKAGTYTFGVCVVDLVGATDCATAKVVIEGASPPGSAPPAQGNLPAGFPTNLPAGTYHISLCASIPNAVDMCTDAGTYEFSSESADALVQALTQVGDQVRSSCACTVRYTAFDGKEFDLVFATQGGGVTTIRVTKVE